VVVTKLVKLAVVQANGDDDERMGCFREQMQRCREQGKGSGGGAFLSWLSDDDGGEDQGRHKVNLSWTWPSHLLDQLKENSGRLLGRRLLSWDRG
jgi:hypothetical protein